MALDVATGHNQFSGTYIPEIWSRKVLKKFYDSSVLGFITNTDYEGEIKNHGDKVKVRTTPDVKVRDYVKGQNLQFDHLQTSIEEMVIDRGKYYAFKDELFDSKQSDLLYREDWQEDAAIQLKLSIEDDIFTNLPATASALNKGATAGKISKDINLGATGAAIQITAANVIDKLMEMAGVLDEQNVPDEGRFVVIPSWIAVHLRSSDLRSSDFNTGSSPMRNGFIGMIDRFSIYRSNRIPVTDDAGTDSWNILFGQMSAVSFATQITEHRDTDNPFGFGTLHKGLCVYGFKTFKPEALGVLYAKR